MTITKKKPIVCKLTKRQDAVWEDAFSMYLNDGYSEKKAGDMAIRDLILEFPKLKKCDLFE